MAGRGPPDTNPWMRERVLPNVASFSKHGPWVEEILASSAMCQELAGYAPMTATKGDNNKKKKKKKQKKKEGSPLAEGSEDLQQTNGLLQGSEVR
jgi:hypothetical protein